MKYTIKTIDDINDIRYNYQSSLYDRITIDLKHFNNIDIIRWALKYAIWNLSKKGKIKIINSRFKNSLMNDQKKLWFLKRQIFKSVADSLKVEELSNEKIVFTHDIDNYKFKGISLCVVFSGNEAEKEQLISCLHHISASVKFANVDNFEVIISGPSQFNPSSLNKKFPELKIKYTQFDNIVSNGRILISDKKNHLFKESKFDAVVILHTRIFILKDFIKKVLNLKFDLFAPNVFIEKDNKRFPYISFQLINKNITKGKKILNTSHFGNKYLSFLNQKTPYIDGGIIVMNKKVFSYLPYNKFVSWDEAEDVEMSLLAYENGLLVDYLDIVNCKSNTIKYNVNHSYLKRKFSFLFRYFFN